MNVSACFRLIPQHREVNVYGALDFREPNTSTRFLSHMGIAVDIVQQLCTFLIADSIFDLVEITKLNFRVFLSVISQKG